MVVRGGPEVERLVLKLCLDNNIRVLRYEVGSGSIVDVFMSIVKGPREGRAA